MARPTSLTYTGEIIEVTNEAGAVIRRDPDRWFNGVPARDLDESDIAQLSDEQITHITGGNDPLYVAMKAKPAKATADEA